MVDDTSNTRWLTLSVNSISGLRENEHYSAIIYTVNNNGRAKSAGSIDFSEPGKAKLACMVHCMHCVIYPILSHFEV